MSSESEPKKLAGSQVLSNATVYLTSAVAAASAQAQEIGANSAPPEQVTVTARRVAIPKLPDTIMNTPQSVSVVPREVIDQQGLSSLQDALRNVPGITLNAGEGGTHGDQINLRGFAASDDFFLDGLRDTGFYTRDPFDYETIEIYKGPASTLFGRGSTGGVINQVTKSPQLSPLSQVTLTLGSNAEARSTADVNYMLDDTSALRIGLMGQKSRVAGRDYVTNRRWGAAPSLAFGLGTDTELTLKYLHQQEDNTPDYGIPFLFGTPAPVPRNFYYGLPADDRSKTDVDVATGNVQHRLSDALSVSETARYGYYWFDSRQTAPTYGSGNGTNPFNPPFPVLGTPLTSILVERDRPSVEGVITTAMNDLNGTAKFATGWLTHTLVAGIEADEESAKLKRFTNQNTVILPTPLLAPDPNEAFPGPQTAVRQRPATKTDTLSFYAVDTIAIGEQWDLTAALRYDNFAARFDEPITAAHFRHTDDVWSPRVALVYKPQASASFYVSYGTSFDPSAENLSLAASNAGLEPEKDRTYEAGAKTSWLNGMLSATFAAFNTEMTNARIADPANPSLQTLAGTEKVNGIELGLQGRLTENWELMAGYTYLDASAVGLIATGVKGPIPNTAHHQANLWTSYRLGAGWEIGTGLTYVGKRQAGVDTATIPGANLIATVPSSLIWDGMVSYRINPTFKLQLNGLNLTDEYYYANSYFTRPGENHAIPGPGRTILLTLTADL